MKKLLLLTSLLMLLFSCVDYPDDGNAVEDQSVCVEGLYDGSRYYTLEFENICLAQLEGFTQDNVIECNDISNPGADANYCYNFVYPIQIQLPDETTQTINSDLELRNVIIQIEEITGFPCNPLSYIVYPFDVTLTSEDNQPIYTVTNPDYLGVLYCEYTYCGLTYPEVEVLDVTGPSTYNITIDFDYLYNDDEYFEIHFLDGTINTYQFSELPLTINIEHAYSNYEEYTTLYIKVQNIPTLCIGTEFLTPMLETNCWEYIYPISFNTNEGLVTVETDEALENILLDTNLDAEIVLPFDVVWYNETINTIMTLYDFENNYEEYKCE